MAAHHREDADHAAEQCGGARDREGGVDLRAAEEARLDDRVQHAAHGLTSRSVPCACASVRSDPAPRWPGDDDDAPVQVEHVDVVAIELAQHFRADDLVRASDGRAAARQIDHAVHRR